MSNILVTGIGTGVGKTIVAAILTVLMQGDYWKPIESGTQKTSDTSTIKKLVQSTLHQIHPPAYSFQAPLSPHHAARLEKTSIHLPSIEIPHTTHPLIIENDIFNAFLSNDLSQAFLHGHSYTANPLACASALASLDLLLEKNCFIQRKKIAEAHKGFCHRWKSHPKLKRCESLGTLLVVEYHTKSSSYFHSIRDRLYHFFLDNHIFIRPLGNTLYLLPPYCIELEELNSIYDYITFTLENNL